MEKEKNKTEKRIVKDEVTEKEYVLKDEDLCSKICAISGLLYSIILAVFFIYIIFSAISGNYELIKKILNINTKIDGDIQLLIFAFIGGALGSITKEIRSIIFWHIENRAYGKEFFWKVVSSPVLGGILAVFIYSVLRSGVFVIGAEFNGKAGDLTHKIFSIFAISFITGFGSEKAIKWINYQVKNLFKEALKKEKTTSTEKK